MLGTLTANPLAYIKARILLVDSGVDLTEPYIPMKGTRAQHANPELRLLGRICGPFGPIRGSGVRAPQEETEQTQPFPFHGWFRWRPFLHAAET